MTQPPDQSTTPATRLANGGPASSDIKASEPLHGRMLHVSRLATIGEMAAGVAHELNQPLTAITNYAQACDRLLAKPDADLGDVRQALREIASQAVRAGDIIRRLRTLARGNPIERASTDINTVVTEILELLQPDARLHAARLLVELGTALPPVCVDRVQIQHVILNLARNALEAMNSSSSAVRQLQIRTARAGDADIEVCVCDSGPGLAPAALERMFDPFFSTKPDGTGLGLPISNTIARAHGGSLGYRPNEPRGACFYIRLPCAAPA